MDNFQRTLLSVPTLIKDHKAALFHPEHGVVIANISKEAFSTADNDIYQIRNSHKQANKNLHMKVTATNPWELIHIDIAYIEPNYKGERYQLT